MFIITKNAILDKFIDEHGGYLCFFEAMKLGISKAYLQQYAKNNALERVAHGVYKADSAWQDDMYVLSIRNRKAVFSHDTALMLHGFTEREPDRIFVTVPSTYNATHLRKKGISVYQSKDEWASIGVTEAKTPFGNNVPVYNAERTFCDILRLKNKKDKQMFIYAIKEYAKSSRKDLALLAEYASVFHIEDELRLYTEMIL